MIMTSQAFGEKDKKSPVGNVDDADNGKNHLYAILWTKTSSATGIRAPSLQLCSESSPSFDIYILVTLYRFDIEKKYVLVVKKEKNFYAPSPVPAFFDCVSPILVGNLRMEVHEEKDKKISLLQKPVELGNQLVGGWKFSRRRVNGKFSKS